MPKFDWGRFGSALATNVGNMGQQYFMNKALQQEEEKRAYTRAKDQAMLQALMQYGPSAVSPEAFQTLTEKYGKDITTSFGGGGLKARDLEQKKQELELAQQYQPPSAFAEKFQMFMNDPENYQKFIQAGLDPYKILQQIKLSNDIEEYEYKKSQRGRVPISELPQFPGAGVGTTEDQLGGLVPSTQLPPKTILDLSETEGTIELLNDWKTVYDTSKKAGYSWVGPWSGIRGGVEETFAGGQLEPGQAEFYAMEARVKNMVIKKITGAQLGEKEAERIMKEIPARNMPSEVWEARWKQTMKNVERLDRIMANKLKAAGYNVPKKEQKDSLGIR